MVIEIDVVTIYCDFEEKHVVATMTKNMLLVDGESKHAATDGTTDMY